MIHRSRTMIFTAGAIFVIASGAGFGEDGSHPKTTQRIRIAFEALSATAADAETRTAQQQDPPASQKAPSGLAKATFGTGCFWCTEAIFEELQGVKRVVSGYSGGHVPNPTYEQVLTGRTGHAEAVHILYDPKLISYAKLLEVFWMTHDPTTLNRQGNDVGTQYRSAIFYYNDEQRTMAARYKEKLIASRAFRQRIVTEITKFGSFFPANGYHQDYFAKNGRLPYCRYVVRPKLRKFRRVFREDLKGNN